HRHRGVHPLHVRDSDAQNRRGDEADSRIPGQQRGTPTPASSTSPTRSIERSPIDTEADPHAASNSKTHVRAADADSSGAAEGAWRVGGDVKAPVVVKRVEPNYSDVARKAHIQGVVIVEATIDRNGNVDKVKVLKGLSMGLTEAAEEAVKQWRFKPGTLNGEPVDVIFNLTVNFTLQ